MPIVLVPEPVLRLKTKKVRKIDASIQKLIDDMIETMHDAPGVGLAATQVGVALRICVIHIPGDDVVTLVNPEIVRRSGSRVCEGEGCLSLPGYKGDVPRSEKVVVKGLNRAGRPRSPAHRPRCAQPRTAPRFRRRPRRRAGRLPRRRWRARPPARPGA